MPTKILLTGLPRSGKSTLLERVLESIPDKRGFVTREVRRDNERIGFEIVDDENRRRMLASVEFDTPQKVSRYCVDIPGFERTLPRFFRYDETQVLYLDEIGQMELFSDRFKALALNYLNSTNTFIGTISKIYEDEFIKSVKGRSDIVLIEITPENREQKYGEIRNLLR
jgi:nucleoside-triphosphatase